MGVPNKRLLANSRANQGANEQPLVPMPFIIAKLG